MHSDCPKSSPKINQGCPNRPKLARAAEHFQQTHQKCLCRLLRELARLKQLAGPVDQEGRAHSAVQVLWNVQLVAARVQAVEPQTLVSRCMLE